MRAQALGVVVAVVLVCAPLWAGISEEDLPPPQHAPRVKFIPNVWRGLPQPPRSALDAYVETLRQRLQHATDAIPDTGLVEVRLSIRRDGRLAFAEVVPLDGQPQLRTEVLQCLQALGPLPAPPVSEDLLLVSIPLATGYPDHTLRDGFGPIQNP
jgi:hypothetical protein